VQKVVVPSAGVHVTNNVATLVLVDDLEPFLGFGFRVECVQTPNEKNEYTYNKQSERCSLDDFCQGLSVSLHYRTSMPEWFPVGEK
jgi:hypothetical protein